MLAEAGADEPSLLLCLRCPITHDQTCALQIGFLDGSELRADPARLARLASPLLMWFRSATEKHALELSLANCVSQVPSDLMDRQAQVYAREFRQLFFQTRQLTRHLAVVQGHFQTELRQAVVAQDEEREWIALEVHDRIAQTLASIFQQLQTLEGLVRSYPNIRQVAVRGSLLCREAIKEARNIMNDLQPPVLDDLGLVPVMEDELQQMAEKAPCRVNQTLSLAGRLPRSIELTLYRIFREALVNIRRHAHATQVQVALHAEGEGVRLEVSDNGSGFDVQDAMERKRVGGLLSMRRRAELSGGAWQVQSDPGQGTRVSAWLPLSPPHTNGGGADLRRGSRP
ncbi:MAG: sensor histidine kinase [Chloroflexota bacterium]|nr:sensor histidine kinase [Chloroflexota bacterium]